MASTIRSLKRFLKSRLGRHAGSGPGTPQLDVVHSDSDLRVTTAGDPAAPGLFVCFTGIRQAMGGIGAEEFVGSTAMPGYSALFVSDLERSWYNGFEPERLADVLRPRAEGKRVVTIGNSMGGFGAIWATTLLDVDVAIAFAPQFSVHPDIVPGEERWKEFTSRIEHFRHPSLEKAFAGNARIYTINGDDDEEHWSRFPQGSNRQHVVIAGSGHDPALSVKKSGALSDLLTTCIRGGDALDVLERAGLPVKTV